MSFLTRNRACGHTRNTSGRGFQPRFESLEPRVMLAVDTAVGDLDFKAYQAITPINGEHWFSMTSTQAGLLTAVADPRNPGTPSLGLYDSMSSTTPLATGTEDDGTWRLDYATAADQEYFLKLGGTSNSVDMLLANLFNKTGTTATVGGTSFLDEYEFNAGASRVVTVNGIKYAYSNSELTNVTIDGEGGLNTVVLRDSPGDDTLLASPGQAVLSNGEGDSEPNFTVTATGMVDVQVYGTAGGTDAATLNGSDGADKLKVYDDFARLRTQGGATAVRAKLFDTVNAAVDAGDGSKDVAVFRSTTQDDTFNFNGAANSARIQSALRDVTGKGFDKILAYGEGGNNDVARFTDMPGTEKDVFYMRNHKTELVAANVSVTARAFDEVHATASQDGDNVARLYDTAQDEHFEFVGNAARVYRESGSARDLRYAAVGFDLVKAHRSEGDDTVDEQTYTYELIKRGFV